MVEAIVEEIPEAIHPRHASRPENHCSYAERVSAGEIAVVENDIIRCANNQRRVSERFPNIKLCVCTTVHNGGHRYKLNAEIQADEMHSCLYRQER